jgi:uncharacterized ion transporter superfamily protein YfcC
MGTIRTRAKLPHTLILIYAMVVLTVVATWLVPAGQYERVERGGKTMPVSGSFHPVAKNPQGLAALLVSPVRGFVDAALIIGFCFIVGGSFGIVQKTGTVTTFIHKLALTFSRRPGLRRLLIPVIMVTFSLGGAVFGMCEETMPFILVFVPLSLSLGYDTITGVAMPFVGAAAGFAGAFFNPFTVGIAQGIAGLPLYSGLGFRLGVWAVGTAIAIAFVMRYAEKIRANPRLSLSWEQDEELRRSFAADQTHNGQVVVLPQHRAVLAVFLLAMVLLVYGILKYKWYIGEISGLFLALGIAASVAGRLSGEEAARAFTEGAKDMISAALIIGCARAILLVATDGQILDTTLHAMETAIAGFHPVVSAQLMFVSQCVINFFVHSGTAQAALTMPIMAPLGDLVGITRQTAVYAFQLAEYINPILPTSGVTMGVLGLARLRWEIWARWFWPLMAIWVGLGLVSLVPPVLTGWGPM